MTSSMSGTYQFSDLMPGQYSLSFTKAGYEEEKLTINVQVGKPATADVLLKAKTSFALSQNSYDFSDLEVSKTFYLYNYSDRNCSYEFRNLPEWLSFDKMTGTVSALGTEAVTAYVDRSKVGEGSYSQNITVSYTGKESGSLTISLSMKKVVLSAPKVTIDTYASNVKQNSFDVSGSIAATGGSQVLSYGHCWNLTGNPTVNDHKTDFGTTDAALTFKSTASNLSVFTTYYVRAYARNAHGITYSDQIEVTTQDYATDKWDGNKATSFSGGSGTMWDPYIITTGGQLLLVKDYPSKYFALGGNIDLNNKNWLPFSFSGTLDGKGYTISNLYINRTDDYQGLFSQCSGTVSDLTIKNVTVNAPQCDYVGVISGKGGTFTNCKVLFSTTSSVTGNNYVGGISGGSAELTACSVISDATGAVVRGSKYIGGLLGRGDADITSCSVDAVVAGSDDVGGITGTVNGAMSIENCYFHGKAMGENNVGGIAGYDYSYSDHQIRGCKVDADITATEYYAGGVIGRSVGYTQVIGCYTMGSIASERYCGGLIGYAATARLSYSTMKSSSSDFYGLGYYSATLTNCATVHDREHRGTNVKIDCKDITSFLRECYSEYATYWNFNNTWLYNGTVSCPKLAWEK
jgi:hypothetical protein